MATSLLSDTGGLSLSSRPPGLYFEFRQQAERRDSGLATGVPVFVGFHQAPPGWAARQSPQIVDFEYWRPHAWGDVRSALQPAAGSHLEATVRGFFANGGRRCVLATVPWPPESQGNAADRDVDSMAQALIQVFELGGVLDDRSDIDLVCVPDAVHPRLANARRAVFDVQQAALAHCERMGDRFALLDAWMGDCTDEAQVLDHCLLASTELRSAFGAVYAPWLLNDPARELNQAFMPGAEQWRERRRATTRADAARSTIVPPCGHIAGTITRIDSQMGPQHAPANVLLDDALDTTAALSATTRARLNEAGINGIHAVRGVGVRVGGARTRSGQAPWLYISTVRVVLEFRRWVASRMSDLVFEPLSPALWGVISTRLTLHCLELQRDGALVGGDPSDAFFVKCDAETNPPAERDLGRIVAHVGLAPTVPAEFIVIRVVQEMNGFTIGGLS